LDGRWAGGLQGRVSYSYVDAEQPQTQQILSNSPQHLGKLDVSVPVGAAAPIRQRGRPVHQLGPNLGRNTISGFSVLNFTLLGHTLGKHLDLSASVYNVFNKTYFNPGQPRTQKIPFNRTEELSGSNSQAGFEAQHAILGKDESKPSQPRLRATLRIGLSLLALQLVALQLPALGQQQNASEDQVKAAYLFNFAKLAEWPRQVLPDGPSPVVIGVAARMRSFLTS